MMESQALEIGPSPDVFVQDVVRTGKSGILVRLTEAQFRAASFLDQRVLLPETERDLAPWDRLAAASEELPAHRGPDFIFHLGHVGSTLISRILGDHPQILALREPPWLRTLTDAAVMNVNGELWPGLPRADAITVLTKLSARVFRAEQRVTIKATSFASELAPSLLAASNDARILALVASPQIHMTTLLAGENSKREVDAMGPSRLLRLSRRAPDLAAKWQNLSTGEKCAATWLSEMASIATALNAAGTAGLAIDFDRFLTNPREVLAAILAHFRAETSSSRLDELAASPHMTRYSKAQSYEYSPQLRRQLLNEAWTNHADEIRKGLNWLQRTIASSPPLAALLTPFWRG